MHHHVMLDGQLAQRREVDLLDVATPACPQQLALVVVTADLALAEAIVTIALTQAFQREAGASDRRRATALICTD